MAPKFYDRDDDGVPTRWVEMVRHTLQVLGPKVLASRMVRDYTEQYYAPAAQSLRRTVAPIDGDAVRRGPRAGRLPPAGCRTRGRRSRSPTSTAPACRTRPLLGSELTLTATVQLAGLRPDEVVVQAVLGRVDSRDALIDPQTVAMTHTGTADGGDEVFSTTTPLPVAGRSATPCGCCRINDLLAADNELGLVRWPSQCDRLVRSTREAGPTRGADRCAGADGCRLRTGTARRHACRPAAGRPRCRGRPPVDPAAAVVAPVDHAADAAPPGGEAAIESAAARNHDGARRLDADVSAKDEMLRNVRR